MPLADDSWLLSPPAPNNILVQPNSTDSSREGAFLIDKNDVQLCHHCNQRFSLVLRKHNCKVCGNVYCGNCSGMVHLTKRKSCKNMKSGTTSLAAEAHHSLLQASNAYSLSQKLLGIRVCNICQGHNNDSSTIKTLSRENMDSRRYNNFPSKSYSSLLMKSPIIESCDKENIVNAIQVDLKNDFKMEENRKGSKESSSWNKNKVKRFGKRNGSNVELNSTGSKLSILTTFSSQSHKMMANSATTNTTLQTAHDTASKTADMRLSTHLTSSRSFAKLSSSSSSTNTTATSASTTTTSSSSSAAANHHSSRATSSSTVSVVPFSSTASAALNAVADTISATPQDTPDSDPFADPDPAWQSQHPHDAALLVDVHQQHEQQLDQKQQQRSAMRMAVVAANGAGRQRDSSHSLPWGFFFISWISCGCLKPQTC
mmetsp:Transcript_30258/g.43245  ORF Transcript_30258/g.43245 Transcript_30258/m.43245 type:complete len:428 (-) Transcript_30258:209-1492(-)